MKKFSRRFLCLMLAAVLAGASLQSGILSEGSTAEAASSGETEESSDAEESIENLSGTGLTEDENQEESDEIEETADTDETGEAEEETVTYTTIMTVDEDGNILEYCETETADGEVTVLSGDGEESDGEETPEDSSDDECTDDSAADDSAGDDLDENSSDEEDTDSESDGTAATYTVSFDANGGSGSMDSEEWSVSGGETVPECAFSYTAYLFSGWEYGGRRKRDLLCVRRDDRNGAGRSRRSCHTLCAVEKRYLYNDENL